MWLYLIIFFIPVLAYADGDAVTVIKPSWLTTLAH